MSSRESSRRTERRRKQHAAVSREKYDNLKDKLRDWYDRAHDFQEKHERLLGLNEELERENEKLTNAHRELSATLEKANAEIKRWKSYDDEQPDPDLVEELEAESKSQRKTIRSLKKDTKELQEKYVGKIATLERDAMLKDGKIQQLEEGRKDLKERYRDLKEDFREQQRWARGTTSVAPGRD